MLSNATASSLLETCHFNKNLLVVWDDPRDVHKSTLATIVHGTNHVICVLKTL